MYTYVMDSKYSRKLTEFNRQNIVRLVFEGGDTAAIKKQVAEDSGVTPLQYTDRN